MALTDNENEKSRKRNKSRAIEAGSNYRWSDKQKLEAINSYLVLGNLSLTSRVLGIPEITLRVWKTTTWWKEAVDDLKIQEKIQLSNRMKTLVEASQSIVANRLENGDPVLNQKTGEIVMKPVSMKDAHKVAIDLIDRREKVEKATMDEAPSDQQNDDKLERLATKFAEMATKSIEKQINKSRTIDVVDVMPVEDIDAIYDKREEGLCQREQAVQLPTGTDQETGGEDNSPPSS